MNHLQINEKRTGLMGIIFLGITLFLYAPYEMLVPNILDINIPFKLYFWIPLLVVFLFFIVAISCLLLLKGIAYSVFECLICVCATCIYVQGNFLNIDTGILNGDYVNWSIYWKDILLTEIILQVIAIVIIFVYIYKNNIARVVFKFVAFVLTGAEIISLIVIFVMNWNQVTWGNTLSQYSTKKYMFDIGKDETNIVWFLLDCYDKEYFDKIKVLSPEVIEGLDGFTYFSNYTGVYPSTDYSMATLMTGHTYLNESPLEDWVNETKKEGIWLDELQRNDFHVCGYSPYKYTFPALDIDNYEQGKIVIKNNLRFAIQMYKLVLNKYAPNNIKPIIWMDGSEFEYWKGYTSEEPMCSSDNIEFLNDVRNNNLRLTNRREFKYIYLHGAHSPYYVNTDAEKVSNGEVTVIDTAEGVLKIVEEYINKLKEDEVYDNTAIIITADHGWYRAGHISCPMMLVKPINSHGKLKENHAPVSELDFGPTVLDLLNIENYNEYGESIFDIKEDAKRERVYYQYYLVEGTDSTRRLIEYNIDCEDNNSENFKLTGVEYTPRGGKINHYEYCRTCNGEEKDSDWDKVTGSKYPIHKYRETYPDLNTYSVEYSQ